MGGPGSATRRGLAKARVEDHDALDTSGLLRAGWLVPGESRGGIVAWTGGVSGVRQEIRLTADLTDPGAAFLSISYVTDGVSLAYRVGLTRTSPRYGGVRWWLVCPVLTGGAPCGRRVRAVYRIGRHFGCRHCGSLAYRSQLGGSADCLARRVAEMIPDPLPEAPAAGEEAKDEPTEPKEPATRPPTNARVDWPRPANDQSSGSWMGAPIGGGSPDRWFPTGGGGFMGVR